MTTSYGISQNAILAALKSGKSKSEIYDTIDDKKEKLFDKGVKPSTIEEMDKLIAAMADAQDKLEIVNKVYPDKEFLAE